MKEPFYNAELTFNPQKTVGQFVDRTDGHPRQRVYLAPLTDDELTTQWSSAKGIVAMRRGLRVMSVFMTFGLAFGFMFGVTTFDPDIDESVTTNAMVLGLIQVTTPLFFVIIIGAGYAILAGLITKLLLSRSKTVPRFNAAHEVPKDMGAVLFSRLTVKDHHSVVEIKDQKVLAQALGLLFERYRREAAREKNKLAVAQNKETDRGRIEAEQHLHKD